MDLFVLHPASRHRPNFLCSIAKGIFKSLAYEQTMSSLAARLNCLPAVDSDRPATFFNSVPPKLNTLTSCSDACYPAHIYYFNKLGIPRKVDHSLCPSPAIVFFLLLPPNLSPPGCDSLLHHISLRCPLIISFHLRDPISLRWSYSLLSMLSSVEEALGCRFLDLTSACLTPKHLSFQHTISNHYRF